MAAGNLIVFLFPFLLPSLLDDHFALGDIFTRTGSRDLHIANRCCLAFELVYESLGPSTGSLNIFAVFGAIGPVTLSTTTASDIPRGL